MREFNLRCFDTIYNIFVILQALTMRKKTLVSVVFPVELYSDMPVLFIFFRFPIIMSDYETNR